VPLILASTQLDAKRALKAGLVDDACALEILPQVAEDWAKKLMKEGKAAIAAKRRAKIPMMNKLLDLPGLRGIVLSKARKEVMAKTKGQYPAPLKALDLLATHSDDRQGFLEREARALGELLGIGDGVSLMLLIAKSGAMTHELNKKDFLECETFSSAFSM
jgi:3-hydroxyacyl-CoA dehydrogenase/enoyl-CoA hydratase/3-hydroxybutyryl-CoA epimerase